MSELPLVQPGEVIASDHINDLMLRSIQRYATIADRTAETPTPVNGEAAWMDAEGLLEARLEIFDGVVWQAQARVKAFDSIFTGQEDSRTLTTYGGDQSTTLTIVLEAGFVEVCWSGALKNDTAGDFVAMSFKIDGATTLIASDNNSVEVQSATANQRIDLGSSRVIPVNAGSNTFTALYRAPSGGTAFFRRRFLSVKQL